MESVVLCRPHSTSFGLKDGLTIMILSQNIKHIINVTMLSLNAAMKVNTRLSSDLSPMREIRFIYRVVNLPHQKNIYH